MTEHPQPRTLYPEYIRSKQDTAKALISHNASLQPLRCPLASPMDKLSIHDHRGCQSIEQAHMVQIAIHQIRLNCRDFDQTGRARVRLCEL